MKETDLAPSIEKIFAASLAAAAVSLIAGRIGRKGRR